MTIRNALVLVSLAARCAHAAAPTAWLCNGCTEAQFDAAALARATSNAQAHGNVWQYDFNASKLRKYEVEREPVAGGGYLYSVWRVAPASAEQVHFSAAIDAWIDTNHQMKSTVVIDPANSPPGSPAYPAQVTTFINDPNNHQGFYGIVTTPQMQLHLSTYAGAWMAHYIGAAGDPAAISVWDFLQMDEQLRYSAIAHNTSLTVVISMPGGGKATLRLQQDASGAAKWTLVKLIDRNNIDVPMTPGEVAPHNGTTTNYNFGQNPGDIAPFEWYLVHGMNVPVVHVSGWTVACTGSAAGTHCVAQPN